MRHRSTILRLARRHCPAAAVHSQIGTHQNREIFAVGTVVHGLIEAAYLGHPDPPVKSINAVIPTIIGRGIRFEGTVRGPYLSDDVMEARGLALRWLDQEPPVEHARVEGGLAVDADWCLVPYRAPSVRWSGIVDLVEEYEDFDEHAGESVDILRVTDWKSAWPTKEAELGSLQFKGNVLLSLAKAEESGSLPDILLLRVVNLRIPWAWERRYDLRDPETLDEIEGWRHELELAMSGLDGIGEDPEAVALPGPGCFATEGGCPFRPRCKTAEKVFEGWAPDLVATRWATAKGLVQSLEKTVKAAAAERPIKTPGGWIGYSERARRHPSDNAWAVLIKAWSQIGGDLGESAGGLVKAIAPGVGQITAVLKQLRKSHPHLREEWDRVAELAIEEGRVTTFGAMSAPPKVETPADVADQLQASIDAGKGRDFEMKRAGIYAEKESP